MHVQNLSHPAKTSKTITIIADALWILSFVTTWGSFLALWSTWWAPLLGTLFVCHLGGVSEFVHQTVHQNLFGRHREWNRGLGKVAAALISVDFDTYRTFHLDHHRFANTPNDPENRFYKQPGHQALAAEWEHLMPRQKIGRIPRVAKFALASLSSFGNDRPFVIATTWLVPLAILASGYFEGIAWYMIPVKLLVTWYLPLFFLLFIDIVFAQSEHYGTQEVVGKGVHGTTSPDEQYLLSWNLTAPAIIEFFLLKRNIHAEHHRTPGIHWTQARDAGEGRQLPFTTYLRLLWTKGPRA